MTRRASRNDDNAPRAAAPAPVPVAAIDVGATSVRMAIHEAHTDGRLVPLEELVHPVSLGADTFRVGLITPPTMLAICRVLGNFARKLGEYGVREVRAVATSAIRDASNRDIVVDRIRHASGISLTVLDAVEEARLTYQTLLPFLRANLRSKRRHTLLLDLGGGSTEIMVLRGHDLVFAGSRRLGMSRVFHATGEEYGDTELLESVIRNVVNSTAELYRSHTIAECIIINPVLQQVFAREGLALAVENGLVLPSERVLAVTREVEDLSPAQRAARFGIGQTESELLLPAALILQRFLQTIGVKRVFFAEVDTLAGVLGDVTMALAGISPLQSFEKQVLNSAEGLAQKYRYDEPHAQHVTQLADTLYEALQEFFDLTSRDRILLKVAGLLHDIGMFISEYAHHKHGAYLARWSEIIGLSDDDREIISQVIRYHRKATPLPAHREFMALPAVDRMRVTKLAALLRIADALERRHEQSVRSIRPVLTETELRIEAESLHELTVEQSAMAEKADLFEQVTGLPVRLRRKLN